ncbi:FG-GAP repeat domain-containing protein [Chryseobacterium jejuense]|uniref:FG-GAP repeat n=1 Tax=Chryseobacterium jejuense TaxID=445960 RepID=A0A2X2X317_CHRJE|nr:VCBS repeat-containing protein [Chryseobacterium jejuense]SDJ52627.1 hypothetical protein SAMN05421542_3680 [Chryseobacterium jejuense]SQB46317.1 Uncharacterised protein [Chryseobacterium jejuense]
MKKLFTIIIVLLAMKFYSQSNSQSYYKRMFDAKGFNIWLSSSDSSDQLEFAWAVPAHMEALVLMYEKTKEKPYAETLIRCMGNTISRRNDLRHQINLAPIYDHQGNLGPAWSNNHYNKKADSGKAYSHLVHSTNIMYPMAKFAGIIKNDSTLQGLKADIVTGSRYSGMKYDAIADDLIQRIKETLFYHKDQWHTEPIPNSSDSMGYYKERNAPDELKYPNVILPFNMQSSAGRVLVHMFIATKDSTYVTQLNQIANFIKSNTQFNPLLGSNIWTYWKFDDLREDVSHANLTASFPYECHKYDIKKNGIPVYSTSDMEAYYKTFTKDIYISPLVIKNGVNYNAENWDIKDDKIVPPNPPTRPRYGTYPAYMWLYLSKYDDETLYQTVADLQAAKHYYDSITVDESSITLALMSNFENLIVPVNTDHKYGRNSDWRGVAKGNFDGDNDEEFVVIRNIDGLMETLEPYNKGFRPVTNNKIYSGSNNWKGLAAGDFFGDSKSEIIALNDHADANENGFYVLKIENNNLIEQARYTGYGAQSKWAGITAGNFISGGKDDFVAVRNFDKEVFVYQFNGTTPQLVHHNPLNLPANSKIKAIASGNLDSDAKDEIVLLVDAGAADSLYNGIHVYDVDDNGVLTEIAKSTEWGPDSDWKGLAVGDLDGDGVGEIVAQRNFDGFYRVFQLNGNGLSNDGAENFSIAQIEDNIMCLGKFDSSSKNEELVTLRKDGGIVMFSAAKVVNNVNNSSRENKNSDPCQDDLSSQLFSFLKP